METITEIVRSVVSLLLLASLLELLLPEGGISRFIRLAIGLTLAAAIILPLAKGVSIELPSLRTDLAGESGGGYVSAGAEINEQLTERAETEYTATLAKQIAALAGAAAGVERAEAEVNMDEDGNIAQVTLTLDLDGTATGTEAAAEARTLISGFYLFDQDNINCVVRENEHE